MKTAAFTRTTIQRASTINTSIEADNCGIFFGFPD
jgi:hypothetical protein